MKEAINYIISTYFNPIKDKIDYAISVLENNNNYDGSDYAVRNIIESIRDNSLVNLEREIENGFLSFKKLEKDLPVYVDLKDIENDFKITYDNINFSIGDFLDNDMEKDSQMALNSLNELDKKIDTYKNSLVALQDMKPIEYTEKKEIDSNVLDEIDEVLDDLIENENSEIYQVDENEREDEKMDNNEEYNVDALLKHISGSKSYFDEFSKKLEKEREEASDEFLSKIKEINSDNEENDLEPINIDLSDLDIDDKPVEEDIIEDEEYTEKLTKLMDKFNELVRLYEKECHKQSKNQRMLRAKEIDYRHLKKVNDDKRERKAKISRIDYINEAILYTAIVRLNRKIRNSEITINELEREMEMIKQQLTSPTLDPQETFRNNRLTTVGDFNDILGDHNSKVVENEDPVTIVGDTQNFIDFEDEQKKRI